VRNVNPHMLVRNLAWRFGERERLDEWSASAFTFMKVEQLSTSREEHTRHEVRGRAVFGTLTRFVVALVLGASV
jgi:hypothetical protein